MKLEQLLDDGHADRLIAHYTQHAGIPNPGRAKVLALANTHFKGLLAEWRRNGVDQKTIRATLASKPIVEWLIDRAIQDLAPAKGPRAGRMLSS